MTHRFLAALACTTAALLSPLRAQGTPTPEPKSLSASPTSNPQKVTGLHTRLDQMAKDTKKVGMAIEAA